MRIVIGRNTKDAMRVLEIEAYPFSTEELMGNFRRLIKTHHPDYGGKKEMAQKVIEAYNHIKNLAMDMNGEVEREESIRQFEEEEEDLFSLWDVCPLCKGAKRKWTNYGKWMRPSYQDCLRCNGIGKIKIKPFNPVIPKGGIMI
ncbi:MAG: J domain-containing protein [Planctomycetes bacterium]|nr:J domain-containing protein [Planctomycetota bacterium]